MESEIIGFAIIVLVGFLFVGIGFSSFKAKNPVGFWANAKVVPIDDVKSYNKAVGKLWCVFGIVLIFLGLPMLEGQNSPLILLSCIGIMFEVIATMVVYMRIENKYRKK